MEPLRIIRGPMMPLPRADVDTDQIIPKQFLKRIERTGYGEFLFYDWAYDLEGELRPDFVLNDPRYRNAVVLIAGSNFGSGSSREHAAWALKDWGFDAIVAPSFADIFRGNAQKNGLLPIELPRDAVDEMMGAAADPRAEVVIDLDEELIRGESFEFGFEIDQAIKHRLWHGLDDIALTLENARAIDQFEAERPNYLPRITT